MPRHGGLRRIVLAALLLACIVLIALDYGGGLRRWHTGTQNAFDPVERGVASVVDPIGRFGAGLPDVNRNKDRADRLERENAGLKRRLQATGLDRARAAELRAIGGLASDNGYAVKQAIVLDYGPDLGFEWTVRVGAGSDDGVSAGMTVICAQGLVGRVKQVSAASSLVVLAIDPGSSVGTRVQRDGQLGVVTGHGRAAMSYLPLDPATHPRAGDVLMTGPRGGTSYAPGLRLGTVAAGQPSGHRATVTVTPSVDFTSIDVVGVVLTGIGPESLRNRAPGHR